MRNGEAGWRSLDTLKGIAIFSVVFFHVKGSFPGAFPNALGFFYQWGGYLGNYLFFMISGLCISWGYRDKIAGGKVGFFAFMKRRLVKLYPLYFVTELICLFFLARQPGSGSLRPREILRNLLCINYGWFENSLPYNFPCWFLSQLLLLYIVHFAFLRIFKRKSVYGFAALVLWGQVILKAGLSGPFCYTQDGEGFSNYFLGCLLFELLTGRDKKRRRLAEGVWAGLLDVFLLRAAALGFAGAAGDARDVFTFLLCPLLILAAADCAPVRGLLERPGLHSAFGSVSIYVFFWHIPLLRLYTHLLERLPWYAAIPAGLRLMGYLVLLYGFCQACVQAASAWDRGPARA